MGRTEAVMKIVPAVPAIIRTIAIGMMRIIAMGMSSTIGMNMKMHVIASALDFCFPITAAAYRTHSSPYSISSSLTRIAKPSSSRIR